MHLWIGRTLINIPKFYDFWVEQDAEYSGLVSQLPPQYEIIHIE